MPDFPESLLGRPFADDWKIEKTLGEGASAVVFRARKGDELAAIKVYKPEALRRPGFLEEQRERIKRQMDLTEKADHPSLARIDSSGEYQKRLYIVMEYVAGDTLGQAVDRIPVDRIEPLLAQIAGAAQYLESLGVVHRDIKPANIVVDDKFRTAKLLDYGVIKSIGRADITHSSDFVGTLVNAPLEFLIREMKDDEEGWRAVTFYQLGTVALNMITGKPLFNAAENWAKIVREIGGKEPDLGSIRPGVSPELVELVRKCLGPERFTDVRWEDFECHRVERRPLVVLLYAGGTIGATVTSGANKIRIRRSEVSDDLKLLDAFHTRIVRDYKQFKGPDTPMPFDLEWTHMPPAQTILSENATTETWNELARKVESICKTYAPEGDPKGDGEAHYLAGIVVLHGTDTLSYSAASLSLSLRNLPCPVILTGSNNPPNEDSLSEKDPILSKSDAWRNLLRCLEFIQALGHRLTEVFVCFNDTIHVAVNLRKFAIDRTPQPLQRERKMLEEPYFYRNVGPLRQYAWRAIDGLYCNNFYPITAELNYDAVLNDPTNKFRHIRQSPWAPPEEIQRADFSSGVRFLSASPLTLLPDDLRARDDQHADFRVLLLEGYNSGTFPTADGHPFNDFLVELQRKAIPVVLVTRNGLVPSSEPYEMSRIDGQEMPILRLFGLIAETAAPLLSLALADISKDEWNSAFVRGSMELLRYRHNRLEAALRRQQGREGGILDALLSDVLDQHKQFNAREGSLKQQDEHHKGRTDTLFGESKNATVVLPGKPPDFDEEHTKLLRQHFLWMLAEVVFTFETSNSGPDGLAFWNEFGFGWGARVRDTLTERRAQTRAQKQRRAADRERWPPAADRTPFAKQSPAQVSVSIASAKRQAEIIRRFLYDNGVAELTHQLEVIPPTVENEYSDGRLELEVEATKHGLGGQPDELFSTVGYSDSESKFFRRLPKGAPLEDTVRQYRKSVEADFGELFTRAMDFRVSPLDWFLIGCYKALACGLLRDLSFDPWVDRCNNEARSYVEALRQSIRIELSAANPKAIRFKLKYTGRTLVK